MAFFDKISKTLYTDAIQNIGWQPYTLFFRGNWYFNYKEEGLVPLEETADLISCYDTYGIKIRPLSDLIDNIHMKELIEVSSTDYILNDKYCHFQRKHSSLSFNCLGAFLGVPKYRFNQVRTTTNKTDKEVLQFLLENYKGYDGIGAELEKNNVPKEVYYARLRIGWDKEKAKNTPVKKIGRTYDHKGNEFSSQKEMLKHYGISQAQFFRRKKKGLDLEQCLAPTNQKFNSSPKTSKNTCKE